MPRCTNSVLLSLVCFLGLANTTVFAQQRRPLPAADILRSLQQLKSVACVMYVAAHPDDENTRLLAWLAKGQHVRTVYLSLTRGDGGQNILGPEQAAGLGLIRTHELLEARKLDGAEQLFTRAVDFGFSKSAEETFKHWDRIRLIADVVRAIRYVRPDVVICRFPKDSMAGHGQHSASAIIAEQAFDYCYGSLDLNPSDKARLDGMLAVPTPNADVPWKPTCLLFNAFRFGNRSTITDSMSKVAVGQFDPLIGMGYGELAGISRSLHRSQGAGTQSIPGVTDEYFSTLRGKPIKTSLLDGVDTTWNRIGLPNVRGMIDGLIASFNVDHPERSLRQLFELRRYLASNSTSVTDTWWLRKKQEDLDKVILNCMGITTDVTLQSQTVSSGEAVTAQLRFVQRSGIPVTLVRAEWSGGTHTITQSCSSDVLVSQPIPLVIPTTITATNPYWLQKPANGALYTLDSDSLLQIPTTKSVLPLRLIAVYEGDTVVVPVALSSKRLDPLRGDVIEGVRVLPRASVEIISKVVLPNNASSVATVKLHAYQELRNIKVNVVQSSNVVGSVNIGHMKAMSDTLIHVPVRGAKDGSATIECSALDNWHTSNQLHVISYDHLPTLQYLEPARISCFGEPITCTAKTVGYVAGAGDATADALRALGAKVVDLDDSQLMDAKALTGFDAVVVGVRAINVRKTMRAIMPSLLAYVHDGGTLVMQYNTTQEMATQELGPWPLPLSRNRVTEEDAQVTMFKPKHKLFSYPNTITSKDFQGWVQERGLYFPAGFDTQYEPLLAMADEGEQQHNGSLLYAAYGKGHYVYCSLSLFRQLPAGVAGGFRLLANMVSVGE